MRPSARARGWAPCTCDGAACSPGQGVGKDLPQVGELAITATVNIQAGAMDVQILQSTRLYVVQELAEMIGVACWWAHRSLARGARAERPRAVAV